MGADFKKTREEYLEDMAGVVVESAQALLLRGPSEASEQILCRFIEAFQHDRTVRPYDFEYIDHMVEAVKRHDPFLEDELYSFKAEFLRMYSAKANYERKD